MSGYDISGVVLGGMGLAGVFQTLYSILHYNLPAQQFARLDEILQDTMNLFQGVIEEGVITDAEWVNRTELRLLRAHGAVGQVQQDVYLATTLRRQVIAMGSDLRGKITGLTAEIATIRAQIAERSDQARKAQENAAARANNLFVHSTARPGPVPVNRVAMQNTISYVASTSRQHQSAVRGYYNEQPDPTNPGSTQYPQRVTAAQQELLNRTLGDLSGAVSKLTDAMRAKSN